MTDRDALSAPLDLQKVQRRLDNTARVFATKPLLWDECAALLQECARLRAQVAKVEDDAEYWSLVADDIKHSHRCPNNALCSESDREHLPPCDRCRAETAERLQATLSSLQAQLQALETKWKHDAATARKQFGISGVRAWADGVECCVSDLASLRRTEVQP